MRSMTMMADEARAGFGGFSSVSEMHKKEREEMIMDKKSRVLKHGSRGDEVREVQDYLIGLGILSDKADGIFGIKTKTAVYDFQREHLVNGCVDDATWYALFREAANASKDDDSVKPVFESPYGLDEIELVFGAFHYSSNENGTIEIDKEWKDEHIIDVQLSVMANESYPMHKAASFMFLRVFGEMGDLALGIKQIGFWSPRHKMHNSKRGLSTHSWGIACDINWDDNPPGKAGKMNPEIVEIFERNGFEWGGRWRNRDDMHFQYAKGY